MRRILFFIVLILLGSAALGIIRMHETSFWFDEISSIEFATGDLRANLLRFADQMPAYFILLRGWLPLVGQSEVAGRWLSLLLGLITLALTYRLAYNYGSPGIGLLSLIALASSAFFIRYYREMRPYALLTLLGVASTWFYLQWLRLGRRRDAAAYVIVTSVMVYTHFFSGLLVAAQGLYFLIGAFRFRPPWLDRRGWITIGLHVLTGLTLLPYIGFYLNGLETIAAMGKHPAAMTLAQAVDSMARTLTNDSLGLFVILVLLSLAAWRSRLFRLAAMWLWLPLLAVLIVHALLIPVFVNPRYLLFIWPAMAILVALGLSRLDRLAMTASVAVLMVLGAGQTVTNLAATLPGVLTDQPWHEMFTTIAADGRSSDVVITNVIDPVGLTSYREPIGYYFGIDAPPGMHAPIELDGTFASDVKKPLDKSTGAWFITLDGQPNAHGQDAIQDLHSRGYAACRVWSWYNHNTTLTEWQRISGPFAQLGDQIQLERTPANKLPASYHPGEAFDVALGFHAVQTPALDYSVGLYLLDASGKIISQQDGPPTSGEQGHAASSWQPGESVCDVHHLIAPQTPGTYTVQIAVYDWHDGKRLSVTPPDANVNAANAVQVFSFTVS